MAESILMVDDEQSILDGYKRRLRKQFSIETALGPEKGLQAINEQSFAVIVSDMRMPEMDGIQFFSQVKEKLPDAVRIMLTGYADRDTAIEAVNRGNVFRFLTKPCPDETLSMALESGLEQYRLIVAERELLEKTLSGSVNVLSEILSLFYPDIFGRTMRLREMIRVLAGFLHVKSSWEIEVASMLAPIGFVGIPPEILSKLQKEEYLSPDGEEMISRAPEIGARLIANIPRLLPVSKIIHYQNKRYDGAGFPMDSISGEKIPLGARIIKPLSDLLEIEKAGTPRNQAITILQSRGGWYDPHILEKISACFQKGESGSASESMEILSLKLNDLQPNQILISNITTRGGQLLLSAGQRLSIINIQRLRNYARLEGLKEPIMVGVE